MTTIFPNLGFPETNGKRPKLLVESTTRAAEVVKMRSEKKQEEGQNLDREAIRARVNSFLRRVDQLIKNGELENAGNELRQAKELEPRNLYIRALEERIEHLKLEKGECTKDDKQTITVKQIPQSVASSKHERESFINNFTKRIEELLSKNDYDEAIQEVLRVRKFEPSNDTLRQLEIRLRDVIREREQKKKAEEVRKRVNEIVQTVEKPQAQQNQERAMEQMSHRIDELIEQKRFAEALEQIRNTTDSHPHTIGARTVETMLRFLEQHESRTQEAERLLQDTQQKLRAAEELKRQYEQPQYSPHNHNGDEFPTLLVPPKWRKRYLDAYQRCLEEIWADGIITPEEEETMRTVRTRLSISPQEHESLERETQWRVYLNEIVEGSLLTPEDTEQLDTFREQFKIPAEAHLMLRKKVRQEILALVNEYKEILGETATPKFFTGAKQLNEIARTA